MLYRNKVQYFHFLYEENRSTEKERTQSNKQRSTNDEVIIAIKNTDDNAEMDRVDIRFLERFGTKNALILVGF